MDKLIQYLDSHPRNVLELRLPLDIMKYLIAERDLLVLNKPRGYYTDKFIVSHKRGAALIRTDYAVDTRLNER